MNDRNYSWVTTYLYPIWLGIYKIASIIVDFVRETYRMLSGSWYCQFCGKYHPRRRVKYALQIESRKIAIVKVPPHASVPDKPLVCYLGRRALKADKWRPETSSLADALNTMIVAFNDIFSSLEKVQVETVPRHVAKYDPAKPTVGWNPKILYTCNPLLNPDGACNKTADKRYSDNGQILWPDSLGNSPLCLVCPLDPAQCQDYQAQLGARPCKKYKTYTEFHDAMQRV